MLMEGTKQDVRDDTQENDDYVYNVYNEPVMRNAVDVLSKLGKFKKVLLKAKGNSIPNAVAVANIITEKMLKGDSKIEKIILDSEEVKEMGRVLSTIEILVLKNS
ncbi:MAG TPA: DNA-binding protein [Nitrosopumilaceae archaeon]|nr:DNA-binding protein [Nitrosopumilaceae archaeon]